MLRLGKGFDPFLPRPFSIYKSSVLSPQSSGGSQKEVRVEILYKVVGKGTGLMAGMRPGAKLELLGPLGRGFQVPPNLQTAIFVAGGIGVPPLVALAEHLGVRGEGKFTVQGSGFPEETHHFNGGSLTSPPEANPEPLASARAKRPRLLAFLGGKTKEEVLCIKEFERLGAEVQIATEDGSLGFKGLVTEILRDSLPSAISHQPSAIYACGPRPMLAEVSSIANKHRIPCQVSLETLHQQYKLVCKDGPVFDAREIEW